MKRAILFLMLTACGSTLPVFSPAEPCSCRRDIGIVGVDTNGQCVRCSDHPVSGSNGSITIHTNRCLTEFCCQMLPVAESICETPPIPLSGN